MPLSVIGAGLPRTGTTSLKHALHILGIEPCYHGEDAWSSSKHWGLWERALDGHDVDWDGIFDGYRAISDNPGCLFYRELAETYPSAKVILTVRDPDAWFDSTRSVLFPEYFAAHKQFPSWPMQQKALTRIFGDQLNDRAEAVARYGRHNAEVRDSIPHDRLLIFDAKQGWEPLCEFLDAPVPSRSFPRVNPKEEMPKDPALIHHYLTEIHEGRLKHFRAV